MSSHTLPNAPTKKHISKKEYSMIKEWAPQTIGAYHCPETPTNTMHPQDENAMDASRRRAKARSSSMYEEWKAQALRRDTSGGMVPASGPVPAPAPAPALIEKNGNERAEKPSPAQEGLGDTKTRRQGRGSNNRRGRRHSNANNANQDNRDKTASTNTDDESGPRIQELYPEGYTTPNGTYLVLKELVKLSDGVSIPNGDTMYFRPSFVEDPWKGMTAVRTECLSRY